MTAKIGDSAALAARNDPEIPNRDHPWPYLKDMFEFTEVKGDSYWLKCLLCLPRLNEIPVVLCKKSNAIFMLISSVKTLL